MVPVSADNRALLVGVSKYDNLQSLSYSTEDVLKVAHALEQFGFASPVIMTSDDANELEPKTINIKDQLQLLADQCRTGDTLVFYFTGQCFGAQASGYLAGRDTDPANLQSTSLSIDEVKSILHKCKASQILVILDTCRGEDGTPQGANAPDSSLSAGVITDAKSIVMYPDSPDETDNKALGLIMSCSLSQKSYVLDDQRTSVFTACLVQGLNGSASLNNSITASSLGSYVMQSVPAMSKQLGPQNPSMDVAGGDITFLAGSGSNVEIHLLTSNTKRAVMTQLAQAFESHHAGVKIVIDVEESDVAVHDVLTGMKKNKLYPMPFLFSPSVPGCTESLNKHWIQGDEDHSEFGTDPLLKPNDPGQAPDQDLVFASSPLVFVTTQQNAAKLSFLGAPNPWANLCSQPGTIHYSFATPSAGSGLYTMGMIQADYKYFNARHGGHVSLESYLRTVQKGFVRDAAVDAGSTALFRAYVDEVKRGTPKRDFIITYGSNVLAAKLSPDMFAVIYPSARPAAVHRISVLNGSWNTNDKLAASEDFVRFLSSDEARQIIPKCTMENVPMVPQIPSTPGYDDSMALAFEWDKLCPPVVSSTDTK